MHMLLLYALLCQDKLEQNNLPTLDFHIESLMLPLIQPKTMRPHHKPKDSHSHHQHPAGNRRTGWYEKFTVSKQQQAYQYIECVGMIKA